MHDGQREADPEPGPEQARSNADASRLGEEGTEDRRAGCPDGLPEANLARPLQLLAEARCDVRKQPETRRRVPDARVGARRRPHERTD